MKIQEMNILQDLLALLNPKSSCTPKIANIIAEVAKNGETDPEIKIICNNIVLLHCFAHSLMVPKPRQKLATVNMPCVKGFI